MTIDLLLDDGEIMRCNTCELDVTGGPVHLKVFQGEVTHVYCSECNHRLGEEAKEPPDREEPPDETG